MNIKIIPAETKHLRAMAVLLSPTGYWRAGIENNTLGLDYETFAARFVLEPLLPHSLVAVAEDDMDTVLGFMSGATADIMDEIPSNANHYHPNILPLLARVAELELTGFILSFLSVDPRARGQGVGKALFTHAEQKAKASHCDTLSLIVWNMNRDAIQFYLSQNMCVTGSITFDAPISSTLLRMEKSRALMRRIHFLESEEYEAFHLA